MIPSARSCIASLLLLGAGARAASAHDCWILPSAWRPAADERVALDLRIGHPEAHEAVARNPERIAAFTLDRAGDEAPPEPVVGIDGHVPAGWIRLARPGLYRAAYASRPAWLELAPEKFASYLDEEGLERVRRERAELGESQDPGTELYDRCVVALLGVGPQTDAYGGPLGLETELVPARNPLALVPGAPLEVTLLDGGTPVAGALVCADRLWERGATVTARTDARGRACFRLPAAGPWLLTSVVMRRAAPEVRELTHERADWRSTWVALSFELAPEGAPVPAVTGG
jgi:uncharacterized GH25 family protein